MGKTQLTKNIEKALHTYQPAKFDGFEFNYRRKQYMTFECPVTHSHIEDGLVDCVWLAEGFKNPSSCNICGAIKHLSYSEHCTREISCALTEDELRSIGSDTFFPCTYDGHCFWKRQHRQKEETVAIICFEIKVSLDDFRSKNGHNFIGNLNYYVMPYALYNAVKDKIPENIGCITYHYKDENEVGKLRHAKSCTYVKEVNNDLYNSIMHTVLNRQSKQMARLRTSAQDALDKVTSNATSVVKELIERLRLYADYPEEGCYEKGFFGCSNCSSTESKCDNCLWGYRYEYQLENRYDGRKLLNEHFNSLL